MLLGIIGAMEKEVMALRDKMESAQETVIAGIPYWRGTLFGRDAVLGRCGIGKVHAAMCAFGMAQRFLPDLILNIGVAGGLSGELGIGDIVVARCAVQHDADTSALGDPVGLVSGLPDVRIPCDEKWTELLTRAALSLGKKVVHAAIATGDQFIDDPERKRWLRECFGAAACDMEGGAVAQVCLECGIPYAAYRAVSDTLTGNGLEYAENVFPAVRASDEVLQAFISLLPGGTEHGF